MTSFKGKFVEHFFSLFVRFHELWAHQLELMHSHALAAHPEANPAQGGDEIQTILVSDGIHRSQTAIDKRNARG